MYCIAIVLSFIFLAHASIVLKEEEKHNAYLTKDNVYYTSDSVLKDKPSQLKPQMFKVQEHVNDSNFLISVGNTSKGEGSSIGQILYFGMIFSFVSGTLTTFVCTVSPLCNLIFPLLGVQYELMREHIAEIIPGQLTPTNLFKVFQLIFEAFVNLKIKIEEVFPVSKT